MRKLTKPQDINETKSQVDTIVDLIEDGFKTSNIADEFGVVKVEIDGTYLLKDKQEVKDLYKEAGWKDVSFQAKDCNTVFRFRK